MVGGGAGPRSLGCLLGHRISRVESRIGFVEVHGNFPRLQSGAGDSRRSS